MRQENSTMKELGKDNKETTSRGRNKLGKNRYDKNTAR